MPRKVFKKSHHELAKEISKITGSNEAQEQCTGLTGRCKGCGYNFKQFEETICPSCKRERDRCKKFAVIGSDKCKSHGGTAGRPIVCDERGIPIGYNDSKRYRDKYKLQCFEDYLEVIGAKCLMILEECDSIIAENKASGGGNYALQDLYDILDKNQTMFKNMVNYRKLKTEIKTVEITSEKQEQMIKVLQEVLTQRVMAICVNNFLEVLKNNIADKELVDKIYNSLMTPLKEASANQGFMFRNSEAIIKEINPDILKIEENLQNKVKNG